MTREEAREAIKEAYGNSEYTDEIIKALDQEPCGNAIDRKLVCAFIAGLISDDGEREKGLEYIRNMPPVNLQPCDDAISRAEAVRVANGYCHPSNVAKELAKLPPVTPQPKTGHWIPIQEIIGVDKEGNEISATVGYKCSKCLIVHPHTSIFCPSCGAKMVEPQESEDKE